MKTGQNRKHKKKAVRDGFQGEERIKKSAPTTNQNGLNEMKATNGEIYMETKKQLFSSGKF